MKAITRDYPSFIQVENYIENLRDEEGKRVFIGADHAYAVLQYMKYIIEENKLNISDIINGDVDELFDILKNNLIEFILITPLLERMKKYKVYECLKYIAFDEYTCLALDDRVLDNHIEDKKYLLVTNGALPYIQQPNVDIYDRYSSHRTTRKNLNVLKYFIYDTISGVERRTVKTTDTVKSNEYDEIIFVNYEKEYVDSMDYLKQTNIGIPICLFALYEYKQISKYKGRRYNLLLNVESIIIDMKKAYIQYNRRVNDKMDKPIYIKDITSLKDEDIKEVILNNKEIEDICVKALPDDIIEHNYRIGLTTYKNKEKKSSLVHLVDRGESFTNRIHELDDKISYKIDELVVK